MTELAMTPNDLRALFDLWYDAGKLDGYTNQGKAWQAFQAGWAACITALVTTGQL